MVTLHSNIDLFFTRTCGQSYTKNYNRNLHVQSRIIGNFLVSGQSYKGSMIVNYNSRVVPELKVPHFMTQDS